MQNDPTAFGPTNSYYPPVEREPANLGWVLALNQDAAAMLAGEVYATSYTAAYWLRQAADAGNADAFWFYLVRAYDEASVADCPHLLDRFPEIGDALHANECEAAGLAA